MGRKGGTDGRTNGKGKGKKCRPDTVCVISWHRHVPFVTVGLIDSPESLPTLPPPSPRHSSNVVSCCLVSLSLGLLPLLSLVREWGINFLTYYMYVTCVITTRCAICEMICDSPKYKRSERILRDSASLPSRHFDMICWKQGRDYKDNAFTNAEKDKDGEVDWTVGFRMFKEFSFFVFLFSSDVSNFFIFSLRRKMIWSKIKK